jgi:hypothetical protein
MVNAKFPFGGAYGFEKVHSPLSRGSGDFAHSAYNQCKIYGESNDSVFTQNKGSRNTQGLTVTVNENDDCVMNLTTH